jgi:apolipoprotein N-acyltransferase
MRAVEEGLPLARAANTGISGAFDGQGRPIARLGWGIAGSLVVALPGPLPPTVFARFGLPIPLLLCLLCALVALAPSVRRLHRTITISK